MSKLDRAIAGVSCREVLASLSDLVDGDLDEGRLVRIRAHVAECRECEQFGGAVAELVQRLRSDLGDAVPLERGVAQRLRDRLRTETGGDY